MKFHRKRDHTVHSKDDLVVLAGILVKGRYIIITQELEKQTLQQTQQPYWYQEMRLLAYEHIYCTNINTDTKNAIKNCLTCLDFQQTQPKERIIHH